ncbi:MAG TPA: AAA family ATPase [Actinomycetota bacterium]|nr:AAA family ATPase [Actinomycetota bacterium]
MSDLALHQEVLDFLGRDGRVDVVAATTGAAEIPAIVEESDIDAVVSCADLARAASKSVVRRGDGNGGGVPDVHVVAGELTIPILRLSVDVGARGAYRWPEEREELADRVRSRWGRRVGSGRGAGRLIAVVPTRGGAGGTFVATQLAASIASRDISTVLVDGALPFADLTPALGLPTDPTPATIADLRPVVGELNTQHLAHVLRRHEAGFDVMLAPVDSQSVDGEGPRLVRSVLKALVAEFDLVIVHLARGLDEVGLAASGLADVCLLVTTLDLFSLYGARRLIDRLAPEGEDDPGSSRLRVVVNRAARGNLSGDEVRQVLGTPPMSRIRVDPAVPRAQACGEILVPRSTKAARDVDRLTKSLAAELGIFGRAGVAS